MATQRANDEIDIRRQIDKLVNAIRAMDLEALKWIYAPNIVSFDIEPPLRHVGAEAKWKKLGKRLYHVPASARLRDTRPHNHPGR